MIKVGIVGGILPWQSYTHGILSIEINGPINLEGTSGKGFFADLADLETIDGLDKVDTSDVTTMDSMFAGDWDLTDLDVSHFNTSKVTDMAGMFFQDMSVKAIDVSKFDTSKVTDMSSMFAVADQVKILDVSNFDTSKVIYMSAMFLSDSSLKDLDVSRFDTSRVENMEEMFFSDRRLTNLDVSNFDTSGVTNMNGMFMHDYALTQLNVSNFDTSNVTDMSSMFDDDTALTQLDVSNFDTSKVTDMSNMFQGDTGLTQLDVSNFDMSNVTKMDAMFSVDPELWVLKLGSKFSNSALASLTIHNEDNKIHDGTVIRKPTGPGWQAVGKNGTVDNPQGHLYTDKDDFAQNRPAEAETYVWQHEPVADKSTLNVQDVNLTVGDKWDPKLGFKSATDIDGNSIGLDKITVSGKVDTNTAGDYKVTYTNGKISKEITVHVTAKNNPTPGPTPSPSPSPQPTPNPTPTPSTPVTPATPTTPSNNNTSFPDYAAKKGAAVYGINNLYLYKKANFTKGQRIAKYMKKPRIYRPMFVVTDYARSITGKLRYKVTDVNHRSKTAGQSGYITASWKYVRPVYYASKHRKITVISPKGVNAYKTEALTGKVKNYKQGTVLNVKGIVKHNLTTRYILTNGKYVTANRKLVNMGRHKTVKKVRAKTTINRYKNVNLSKRNQTYKKGKVFKVYNYDYSHGYNLQKHGALRYHVAGGYITGNSKYVKVIR